MAKMVVESLRVPGLTTNSEDLGLVRDVRDTFLASWKEVLMRVLDSSWAAVAPLARFWDSAYGVPSGTETWDLELWGSSISGWGTTEGSPLEKATSSEMAVPTKSLKVSLLACPRHWWCLSHGMESLQDTFLGAVLMFSIIKHSLSRCFLPNNSWDSCMDGVICNCCWQERAA